MAAGSPMIPTPPGVAILAGVSTMSVTGTTSNAALPAAGNIVTVINDGSQEAFIAFGDDDTIVALDTGSGLTSIPVPGGTTFCQFTLGTWIAAITATSTTTLRVLVGNGRFFG